MSGVIMARRTATKKVKIERGPNFILPWAKHLDDFDASHMHPNFYNIEKEEFLAFKPLHERLSCAELDYDSFPPVKITDATHTVKDIEGKDVKQIAHVYEEPEFLQAAVRLITRTAYGLFSFITGELTPSLNLNLNSGESNCGVDRNRIQIGLGILTQQNLSRQDRVDVVMALIYHEFYHKRFTNADFKRMMKLSEWDSLYADSDRTREYFEKVLPTRLHGVIHNILEDRRIERLGSADLPGYSFSLEQKRRYAMFLNSSKKILPTAVDGLIIDYILHKILLPEMEENLFNEMNRFVKDGLPKFELDPKIERATYEKFLNNYKAAETTIYKIKKHIESNQETVFSDSHEKLIQETHDIYNLIPEAQRGTLEVMLEKNIITYINPTEGAGTANKNQGGRGLTAEETEALEGIMADEIKQLEKELEEQKKSTSEKRHTEKILSPDNFTPYTHFEIIEPEQEPVDTSLYAEARQISQNIVNNLGFLDSKFSRTIDSFELSEGELDESELYSVGFGNKNVFQDIEELPAYSLDFGILLDESGSMSGRIREAKLAVLSLILGLRENKHINLFVYGHTANHDAQDGIQIYKYYNQLEGKTDWRSIFSAASRSNNADGFAIAKVGEIMKASRSENKILIVVSDGQPAALGYGGGSGVQHTHNMVQQLEAQGFMVVQVCMAYIENSASMFTHFVPYANGQFFENLKNILMQKLIQFSDAV